MGEEKKPLEEFVITIKCNTQGQVVLRDSRTKEDYIGHGLLITMGDAFKENHVHFAWGNLKSVVYGFYGGMQEARHDKTEEGDFYRAVFGGIARMVAEMYNVIRKHNELTPEEALKKWAEEDEPGGSFH
jgi:hypothetical protein